MASAFTTTIELEMASGQGFVEGPPQTLECPICLDLYTLRDTLVISCCRHQFCRQCIERVRANGKPCPLCGEADFTFLHQGKGMIQTEPVRGVQSRQGLGRGIQPQPPMDIQTKHANLERILMALERARTPQQQQEMFAKVRATPEQQQQLLNRVQARRQMRLQMQQQQPQRRWQQQQQQFLGYPQQQQRQQQPPPSYPSPQLFAPVTPPQMGQSYWHQPQQQLPWQQQQQPRQQQQHPLQQQPQQQQQQSRQQQQQPPMPSQSQATGQLHPSFDQVMRLLTESHEKRASLDGAPGDPTPQQPFATMSSTVEQRPQTTVLPQAANQTQPGFCVGGGAPGTIGQPGIGTIPGMVSGMEINPGIGTGMPTPPQQLVPELGIGSTPDSVYVPELGIGCTSTYVPNLTL